MVDTLILIPAYNEAANLPGVLLELQQTFAEADVLVVSDGSSDGTVDIARQYGVAVACHPCNLGYGAALQTGYRYALERGYRYVVQLDADGQHRASDALSVARALQETGADLAIGSRFQAGQRPSLGFLKRLAIGWFRALIYLATGRSISDPTSGLRGLSRRLMSRYATSNAFPTDFPDADFLVDVLLHQSVVIEVPVGSRPRTKGQSMHAGWRPVVYMGKVTLSTLVVMFSRAGTRREVSG
ncbi:MAG: glycosyltransferase family 2 protein [Alicyclobacillus sp.]|nr:glycosyltransferase family 2 protein [Alicyclobacillus sp.]